MRCSTFLLVNLIVAAAVHPVWGQGRRGSDAQVPAPGTMLPDVTAYDEQGDEFSTASLRGRYTVLVFGCLT